MRRKYTRTCAHCGAIFHPFSHTARFCSHSCALKANQGVMVRPKKTPKTYGTRVCVGCGTEWVVTRETRGRMKYCSQECYDRSRPAPATITCLVCGTQKIVPACYAHRRYCSPACRDVQYRQGLHAGASNPMYGQRGELSPRWQGGITAENHSLRTSLEYREWRAAVFERDGYACQECGDRRGGNLQAHHVKPWALYPDLRFDAGNGLTLCEDCHTRLHAHS